MPDPKEPFAQPMAWWGAIQSSVRAHATTADIWAAIREFGSQNQLAYPPGMFQAVNDMRSIAAGLRIASDRLGRAKPETALTSEFVAALPYARQSVAQALLSQYHVRVGYTAVAAGGEVQGYITLPYSGGELPATVGQLYEDAALATDALVNGYNAELSSIDSIEIGAW